MTLSIWLKYSMLNVILLEHGIQAIALDIQHFKMCRSQINNRYDHMVCFMAAAHRVFNMCSESFLFLNCC